MYESHFRCGKFEFLYFFENNVKLCLIMDIPYSIYY